MVVWKGRWSWWYGDEELCKKVVEVRWFSDRVISVVVFEEYVLRLIYGYVPRSGRSM